MCVQLMKLKNKFKNKTLRDLNITRSFLSDAFGEARSSIKPVPFT